MQSIDGEHFDAAQQAAESMSQWGSETHLGISPSAGSQEPGSDSIDHAVCQSLAQIVRGRHKPHQYPAADMRTARSAGAGKERPERRASLQIKKRGGRQSGGHNASGRQPKPELSGRETTELQGALEALQAEERRLHDAVAFFGCDGLHLAAPILADLCVLQEHWHMLQLASAPHSPATPCSRLGNLYTAPAAGVQPFSNCGSISLVDHSSSWGGPGVGLAHAGAKIADVRPGLYLERLYRVARMPGQSAVHRRLLVATADGAIRSGNFQLAGKLLDRLPSFAQASVPLAAGEEVPGSSGLQDTDMALKEALLRLQLSAVTDHTDTDAGAAELLRVMDQGENTCFCEHLTCIYLLTLQAFLSVTATSTGFDASVCGCVIR